jgi:hypothetical protein
MATIHEPYKAVDQFSAAIAQVKQLATAGLPQPSLGPNLVQHEDGSVYDSKGNLVRKAPAKVRP